MPRVDQPTGVRLAAPGRHHGGGRQRLPQLQRLLPRKPELPCRRLYRDADPRYRGAGVPCRSGRTTAIPTAFPSSPKRSSPILSAREVDEVVFAYSDVSHEYVMHRASLAMACGADFRLLGPEQHDARGQSARRRGHRGPHRRRQEPDHRARWRRSSPGGASRSSSSATRCPTATSRSKWCNASPTTTTSRGTAARSRSARSTSPTSTGATWSTPASITARSWSKRKPKPTSSSGTGATTTSRSTSPTCSSPWPIRTGPGHETAYHPGETNLRMADVVVVNKVDSATQEQVDAVVDSGPQGESRRRGDHRRLADHGRRSRPRPGQAGHRGRGRPDAHPRRDGLRGRRHRRPAAGRHARRSPALCGRLTARTSSSKYDHLADLVPAMGYGETQMRELEETINASSRPMP